MNMSATVSAETPALHSDVPAGNSGQRLFYRPLLQARLQPSFGRLEAVLLVLYAAVVSITIPFHEQWADEAQAWLIARDSSLWDIFYRRLHYEGTPGLWHLLLWVATRLHLPYVSENWISAAFATAGVYVWLRYSPFPPLLRYLLPFTFWVQYQYAVTARSYSLVPLFAFVLCSLFYRDKPRPVLFATAAALMANLSLYSYLWAGTLVLFYVWQHRRALVQKCSRSSLAWASAILVTSFLFAFYTAMPAPDLVSRHDGANYFIRRSALRDKLIPPTPPPHFPPSTRPPLQQLHFPGPPEGADTSLYTRGNALQRELIKLLFPTEQSYRMQTLGHRLRILSVPVDALFYSLSASNLLGSAFLVLLFLWLGLRGAFRFTLPLFLMLVLGTCTNINDHHAGLLFLALIAALWLGLERRPMKPTRPFVWTALMLITATMLIEQVAWSARAVISDIRYSYDPGKATAQFLKQYAKGKRVMALQYETVSIVPFMTGTPFENQPTTYWMYDENFPYGRRYPIDIMTRPDFFIIGVHFVGNQTMGNQIVPVVPLNHSHYAIDPRTMEFAGYRELTRFCGNTFMHGGTATIYCNIIYVPKTGA